MIVRELLTKAGISYDPRGGQLAESAINRIKTAAIGLASTFAAGALLRGLKSMTVETIKAADVVAKASRKMGINAQAFQELRHAANLAGVAQGKFDTSMERFVKRIGEAAAGTGTAVKWYQRMNVSIRDSSGNVRKSEDVFMDVADSIAGMNTEAERGAAAAALFGREGVALVNVLSLGKGKIKASRLELQKLGGVFDDTFLKQSEFAVDQMARLSASFQGIKVMIISAVVPPLLAFFNALIGINKWLQRSFKNTTVFETVIWGLRNAMLALGLVIGAYLLAGLGRLGVAVIKSAGAFRALGTSALWAQLKMMAIGIAVLAVLAILFLLADDLYAFFKGQPSLIGKALDKFREWIDELEEQPGIVGTLVRTWNAWSKTVADAFDVLTGQAVESDNIFYQVWGVKVPNWFRGVWEDITFWFTSKWSLIKNTILKAMMDVVGGISDDVASIEAFFRDLYRSIVKWMEESIGSVSDFIYELMSDLRDVGRTIGKIPGISTAIKVLGVGGEQKAAATPATTAVGEQKAAATPAARIGPAVATAAMGGAPVIAGSTAGARSVVNAPRMENKFSIVQQPGESGEALAARIKEKASELLEEEFVSAEYMLTPSVGGG